MKNKLTGERAEKFFHDICAWILAEVSIYMTRYMSPISGCDAETNMSKNKMQFRRKIKKTIDDFEYSFDKTMLVLVYFIPPVHYGVNLYVYFQIEHMSRIDSEHNQK